MRLYNEKLSNLSSARAPYLIPTGGCRVVRDQAEGASSTVDT